MAVIGMIAVTEFITVQPHNGTEEVKTSRLKVTPTTFC